MLLLIVGWDEIGGYLMQSPTSATQSQTLATKFMADLNAKFLLSCTLFCIHPQSDKSATESIIAYTENTWIPCACISSAVDWMSSVSRVARPSVIRITMCWNTKTHSQTYYLTTLKSNKHKSDMPNGFAFNCHYVLSWNTMGFLLQAHLMS